MRDYLPPLTLGALACLTVVGVFAANQLSRLDRGITDIVQGMANAPGITAMQTLTETVTVEGRTIKVTTTRLDNESLEAWIGRHNAAIEALG